MVKEKVTIMLDGDTLTAFQRLFELTLSMFKISHTRHSWYQRRKLRTYKGNQKW